MCASPLTWQRLLPPPSDEELAKLDEIPDADETSRLACQIMMTDDLDGLELELQPDSLMPQTYWAGRLRPWRAFRSSSTSPVAAPLVVGGGDAGASQSAAAAEARRASSTLPPDAVVPDDLAISSTQGRSDAVRRVRARRDIRGRPLVISATGDDVPRTRACPRIARALGVPVNVPDRPHLCTFSLGAIVDRGTVTVAIGTEGAAPVLATQLRAQLEQELHPRLGRLADIAREYRPAVAAALAARARPAAPSGTTCFRGPAADAILAGDEDDGPRADRAAARWHDADTAPQARPRHPGRRRPRRSRPADARRPCAR